MTDQFPRLTIALAAVILVAGCTAPIHDDSAPGDSGKIAVEGAGLPVDPGVVLDRVTRLTGANVTSPDSIRVITPADQFVGNTSVSGGGGNVSITLPESAESG